MHRLAPFQLRHRHLKNERLYPRRSRETRYLTGTHPDETFFREFPEWRAVTDLGWNMDRFTGSLQFRWVDEMTLDSGSKMDSAMFTDLRLSWNPDLMDDALTISVGLNNLLDEDPPVCDACGVISMSPVSRDLPGRVGYIRVTYQN